MVISIQHSAISNQHSALTTIFARMWGRMTGAMKLLLAIILFFLTLVVYSGCSRSSNAGADQKKSPATPPQRFLPVGNDPEIALDTARGILCRTVTDPDAPANLFDAGCEIPEKNKSLQFIPDSCKSGKTWVRSEVKGASTSKYGKLPLCIDADGYMDQFVKK